MSDLFSLLSLGANALSTQNAATATTSHNLENADTPGYSRQTAQLAAMLPAFQLGGAFIGQGVTLQAVTQARDFGVERQFAGINAAQGESTAQSNALQSLSALDPQAAGNVGSSIDDFYSAMRAMAQNPSDLSLRQAALGQAQAATLAFNRSGAAIDSARSAVDAQLSGGLDEVNSLATQMAALNQQIRTARASGGQPNDLLDARQSAQDRLIELTGATPVTDAAGNLSLALPSGAGLVTGDSAGSLSLTPDPTNGGHLALQLTRPDGSGPVSLSQVGGTFGGLLNARDGALKTAQTNLDQMAFDFAGAVNTVHSAGFGLDGVTGRNLFDPGATAAGAAQALTIDASIGTDASKLAAASTAAGLPGDATNLQTLIGTENQPLTGGLSVLDTWSSMVSSYGAAAQTASTTSDADAAALDHVNQLRQSVSGVSTDEELINLQKAQSGYEAVMKVIQTTNDMLSTLMTIGTTTT